MNRKILLLAALLGSSSACWAQAPGDARGSVPPGTAADGSRPADGAIQGGSLLPGERSGMPDRPVLADERLKRCYELSGSLREECLLKEDSASGGASRPPAADGTKAVLPPDAPPPQAPR